MILHRKKTHDQLTVRNFDKTKWRDTVCIKSILRVSATGNSFSIEITGCPDLNILNSPGKNRKACGISTQDSAVQKRSINFYYLLVLLKPEVME